MFECDCIIKPVIVIFLQKLEDENLVVRGRGRGLNDHYMSRAACSPHMFKKLKHFRTVLLFNAGAFTKVLVGLGTGIQRLNNIEVLDLSQNKTKCQNLPNFPHLTLHAVGGLLSR